MGEVHEVKINGYSIYFEELEQLGEDWSEHDALTAGGTLLEWTDDMLQQAARPLINALGAFQRAAQDMAPDEIELSMQLNLALSGNTPVFKVLSMEGSCQFAAKLVWKKS